MTSRPGAGRRLRTSMLGTVALLGLTGAIAACGGSSDTSNHATVQPAASKGGARLALVGYSTPKKAYDKLTAAFEHSTAGKGVSFSQSLGPSGAQSRAVAAGQPADVVAFSTTPDVTRLVKAGIVSSGWDVVGAKGIPSDSVVVLVVRKGNPKHITGWDDLVKPGVDVITPNPATSGSARWNILAGYGAQLKEGKPPAEALAYLKTLLTKNVSVQPSSGSSALQTFTSGKGDVLISYESEAIAAERAGDSLQYVIPKQTLLIETPVTACTGRKARSACTWRSPGRRWRWRCCS
jgi:sulfate/thiosulfate-binding protein